MATLSGTIVFQRQFRPDVDQASGRRIANPIASSQISHSRPSTFHEQLQFAKCVVPALLLVHHDELIDDGFDIVNIAHELLDGGRLFPLACLRQGLGLAWLRWMVNQRPSRLAFDLDFKCFRVGLLAPTSSYTLQGSLGCTVTSWQDAVLVLTGLDRNASTRDAQQGELP